MLYSVLADQWQERKKNIVCIWNSHAIAHWGITTNTIVYVQLYHCTFIIKKTNSLSLSDVNVAAV